GTIGVESINVEEAWITIHRLGERMLVPDLREMVKLTETREAPSTLQKMIRQHAKPVWAGSLKIRKQHNQRVHTTFAFAEVVKDRQPGAYLVTVQNGRDAKKISMNDSATAGNDEGYDWESYNHVAVQWVVDTDLGLTALHGKDGLHVFARSLATGEPLTGVKLSLMAVNNEELSNQITTAHGGVRFDPGLLRGGRGQAPALVMAFGPQGDFTLMDLKRPAFDLSDRGVAGRPHPGEADAYLYTDRGIYRPGETVRLVALLRDAAGTTLGDGQPVSLVARRPNGSEFQRSQVQPGGEGAYPLDLTLPATAARGLWNVTAFLPGSARPVGSVAFDVQDFVPQRLKVLAGVKEPVIRSGERVNVDVDAVFLYGAPASALKGEGELTILPDPTPFPAFKEYVFGRPEEKIPPIALTFPDTDAKGRAVAGCQLPDGGKASQPRMARFTLRVVEPGGRVTSTQVEKSILATRPQVGIRPLFKDGRVREGEAAGFHVVLVSPTGQPLEANRLSYRLVEETLDHHWFFHEGRWKVQTIRNDRLLNEGEVKVTPERHGVVNAPNLEWGRYRLEVRDPQGGGEAVSRFQMGWGNSESADVPDKAVVLADRPVYQPGEMARIHIQAPSPGPVQLVVATDRIWETRELIATAEGMTVEIPVNKGWGAGAYVLVTTYRPMGKGKSRDPVRAMGVAWLGVDPEQHALRVTMEAPDKIVPGPLVVPVQVEGAAGEKLFVTLAAVDEGILQLTRFKSPDPLGHYMGKRKLAVEVRDDYGRLLDGGQGSAGEIRSGGDSLGGAGLPVVPTKSTALFSGLVAVDGQGKAKITLEVPDFNGKLRLMAVAHSRTRVGAAEGFTTVRHPLVGEVSLPRFLAPGDQGRLTLLVQNMDAPSGSVEVRLTTKGAISLAAPFVKTLPMAPEERFIETVPLVANGASGIGEVTLSLATAGFTRERTWSIAVRSPFRPVTTVQSALQKTGESWTLPNAQLGERDRSGLEALVSYGARKELDVPGMLRSLERYPFGCTEQLTSRAMVLLQNAELNANRSGIQEILNQILERQDGEGAIGLYQAGDGLLKQELAAYAVDLLQQATDKGFFVPATSLELAYRWLVNLSHHYARGYDSREHSTYVLYALSRSGQVNLGDLRYLHDNRMELLTPLDRGALGAALYRMGDVARAESAFD
ncbi:MAG: alpha-2-macroglobulin family protein, partial [Magnetococcales bacterium]|nr:alpha-2-macroglobulin family protein [Magnetococcales bacterium]